MSDETFIIEKDVPVTSDKQYRRQSQWLKPDFPFDKMDVGDSFVVRPSHCEDAPLIVVQNIASSAASQYTRNHDEPRKFTTRQIGGKFVRVWRIL